MALLSHHRHRIRCSSSSPPPPESSSSSSSTTELPIFPLPLVLFPGAILPLQIFEFRYRIMMHTLLHSDLRFGVLFSSQSSAAASIGCVAEVACTSCFGPAPSNNHKDAVGPTPAVATKKGGAAASAAGSQKEVPPEIEAEMNGACPKLDAFYEFGPRRQSPEIEAEMNGACPKLGPAPSNNHKDASLSSAPPRPKLGHSPTHSPQPTPQQSSQTPRQHPVKIVPRIRPHQSRRGEGAQRGGRREEDRVGVEEEEEEEEEEGIIL